MRKAITILVSILLLVMVSNISGSDASENGKESNNSSITITSGETNGMTARNQSQVNQNITDLKGKTSNQTTIFSELKKWLPILLVVFFIGIASGALLIRALNKTRKKPEPQIKSISTSQNHIKTHIPAHIPLKKEATLVTCSITDRGSRNINEDACEAFTIGQSTGILHVLAVADGLGGHRGGDIASKLAINELIKSIRESIGKRGNERITRKEFKEFLAIAYNRANTIVYAQGTTVLELHKMGSTLVAAIVNNTGAGIVANIGDSRAYQVGKSIRRITKDQSYVQELVDRDLITPEEAAVHPQKNVVNKIIGMKSIEPDFYEIELGEDTIILCSDGITDSLDDDEIRDIVINSQINQVCKNLIGTARPKCRDNITVVAGRLK